ncbi:type II toxin-antitoxin system Phd/YefM family antitoxin [Agreia pratensis]|uniref:Antitoxin n=1 Tax=Agreia pratensis TaxID=150121 RepID=A0A1X7J7S4_9MICO|nr:type II toxin-antitoxin system prevent-host-death family antitoxin [Agreia pratensis]MBF4635639.1 type II toxin-antitoxin system Phd/YefM family antitoxin [Agreia pratensis]SMG23621.1 prevent-host-death family protein [Agreia pratensis]
MRTVNMHDAKTHFSRLVSAAEAGESIIIAKAGRPVAKLVALTPAEHVIKQRIGFLSSTAVFPDDTDTLRADEIAAMFSADE